MRWRDPDHMGRSGSVRARAPLRLGLAGGGTDLSPYAEQHGGIVLNCTIDRYAYAFLEPSSDGRIHLRAADLGLAETHDPDAVRLQPRALALHAGVYRRMMGEFASSRHAPLALATHVDAPPGSGLGASSALAVALVEAFRRHLSLPLGPHEVARLAVEIERLELGLPGGQQDQYAAAFGGINLLEFAGGVTVTPLRLPREIRTELEASLVTCWTGASRQSDAIIAEQQRGMGHQASPALDALHQLRHDAIAMARALQAGDIAGMADILNRSWRAKKLTAAGVSTPAIDRLLDVAMAHKALGGKVSGAGGGGFMMFLVAPQDRLALIRALGDAGAQAACVQFTRAGAHSWRAGPGASRRQVPAEQLSAAGP